MRLMGKASQSALSQSSRTKNDGTAPVEVWAGFGLESVNENITRVPDYTAWFSETNPAKVERIC